MSHWRRTRMVSFRVSDQEFEMLKTLSESQGARSVSEFARLALCGRRKRLAAQQDVGIDQLRREFEELKAYLRTLADALERTAAARPSSSPLVGAEVKSGEI